MSRIVLSAHDVERQRPLDITRTVLRQLALGEAVSPESVNQKAPLIFGYPNSHAMHAEAKKTPLPAPGMLSRTDIRIGLTKNLCEVANVPFLPAFRAVGKAKLQILDVDQRTVEACADEQPGGALKPNPRIGSLIAAGAPAYCPLVRKDGSAFDWSFLMSASEVLERTAGGILAGDPLVADCNTPDEAIDRYLREAVIPAAWVTIEDLVSDGLEIPHHEEMALFTKDGGYIGCVLRHAGLNAVIPRLFCTDEELAAGKVSFFTGHHEHNDCLGRIVHRADIFLSRIDIRCDEPVYFSRTAVGRGLSVKKFSEKRTVDTGTLELLPGLRCGSSGGRWTIEGEVALLHKDDRRMFNQSYVPTIAWPSASDFPLLFPLDQDVSSRAAPGSWSDRFKQKILLAPETVEFQQRLSQKLRRSLADAREVLEDPAELTALLRMLLDRVSVEQIESTAVQLEASFYSIADGTGIDEVRIGVLQLLDRHDRSQLIATLLRNYPFLAQFGPTTHWVIQCGSVVALGGTDSDLPAALAVLVELIALASASAAGKPSAPLSIEASILAAGRWAEGLASLEDVISLASVFKLYQDAAAWMEASVASIGAAVTEAIDRREQARELGVAYAGERVTVRPSGRARGL
ncbi:hypothetical protein HX798_22970 [Pseudomonas putida]|uniref:Uncharacterized protein n=1 Tax=Pseudomonas putida TaxID=303 RepID=A0A7Y7ZEZ4_PSEPU|nr:hypothetical protein [Pseudomonas putida]NWC83128.1 hypothetical protein [Pseudomonas putida]